MSSWHILPSMKDSHHCLPCIQYLDLSVTEDESLWTVYPHRGSISKTHYHPDLIISPRKRSSDQPFATFVIINMTSCNQPLLKMSANDRKCLDRFVQTRRNSTAVMVQKQTPTFHLPPPTHPPQYLTNHPISVVAVNLDLIFKQNLVIDIYHREKIALRWMVKDPIYDNITLVQAMAWCIIWTSAGPVHWCIVTSGPFY